ncbi:class I SAM-dependent methyltransferase [Amycolatopsis saalfeldensis]|uniref:Methylation protein EvaC n=1 Tax=Amycolatopsis saalfeldensis TaxID=394193 RepID=A0A1H8YJZ4_9PSEU|nr:class I SAM-dependent methyltransferase [Amycolatopsis saalfeldensis]SEP52382.1 methylation protein EvaC [Amycolatopsis saalfeldensis]
MSSTTCQICDGEVEEFLDLGRQPLSDAFPAEGDLGHEFFYRLAVGMCRSCSMVQSMEQVPRERMFNEDYPYYSSGSSVMRAHFEGIARGFLGGELARPDPFIVEIGSNDGVLLKTIHDAGVRHVGFEPSGKVAAAAAERGVRVLGEFFDAGTAAGTRESDGPADVIFAANTICHIPYLRSILAGVKTLLAPDGVFVFEDPYLGDIVAKRSFDQIYDEHFFLFSARAVQAMAARFGLELVDVERLAVHGGEVRYTIARAGARKPKAVVADLIAAENARQLADLRTLRQFAAATARIRDDLVATLRRLRAAGHEIVGYGATAKSATVTNFCGIGPDLVSYVCDTTPAKQGRFTPGTHIPIRPAEAFSDPYPDFALLFAWNHENEIMAKEQGFRRAGGQWIRYVPDVHLG